MRICFNKIVNSYIAIMVLTLLILVRDLGHITVPFIIFSFTVLIFGLLTDSNGRLLIITYLLPFCRALPYSELLIIVLFIDTVFSIKKIKVHSGLYLPILLIIAIELLDYIRFNIFSNEIIYLVLYMLYAVYVIDQGIAINQESKIAKAFSIGTIVAVISVVIREVSLLGMNYITVYGVRFGTETNGLMVTNFNSNELAMYCAVAASLMIVEFLHSKDRFDLFLGVIVSALGFVSVSRTYLIIISVLWLWYIMKQIRSVKGIIFTILILIILLFILTYFFSDFTSWIMSYYSQRNKQASLDGFGGRTSIMSTLFKYYFSSLWSMLFGYSEMYPIILNLGAAHNGLQEMLISWGLVGFIILIVWIIMLFRFRYTKLGKISKTCIIPFIVFLLFIQTLQFFAMHNYLILMTITIVYISSHVKKIRRVYE